MNEKTKEIYQFLLSETDYLKEAGKSIEKVVEDFLQKNSLCLSEKEYEEVRDELFAVTSFAEEAGFIKGFQYAVMLMSECYTAKNYCRALTIFKICSLVSLLQACSSWSISCSIAEEASLYSSERT